ncbi:MAG: ATP-binding protein [Hyphomicrobiales bacterium]
MTLTFPTTGRTLTLAAALGALAVLLPILAILRLNSAEDDLAGASSLQRDFDLASVQALEAETALRGYQLSGDPAFLPPYNHGVAEFERIVAGMDGRLGGDSDAAAAEMLAAFRTWRDGWAQARIDQVAAGDLQGAQALTTTGQGRVLFDAYRTTAEQFSNGLDAQVAEHEDDRDRAQVVSFSMLIGAAIAAAAAAGLITWVAVRHAAARRSIAETEAKLAIERATSTRRGELLAVASHELRNPLTALVLSAQLLEEEAAERGDEELAGMAGQVTAAATRAAQMIVELLDFTRVEAGRLTIAHEQLSPLDVVEGAIEDVRLSHREVPVEVEMEAPPGATIEGDRPRLRMVLRNLIENALRYGKAPIRVRVAQEGADLAIHVEDAGNGVPGAEREMVFQQFQRGSTSKGPGAGIGLYISRGIVELHGGSLEVHQSKLGGADFVVRLPRESASAAAGGA